MKKYRKTPLSIQFLWLFRVIIFILLSGCLIDIQVPITRTVISGDSKNIAIVLDISRSMKTDDILPSRLEGAKTLLNDFLSHESIDRYGYIIFAGKPFTLSPLTKDRKSLQNLIQNTTTDTINQGIPDTSGTNIGDALLTANMLLSGSIGKNVIILITDGRANLGINPIVAAKESAKIGIPIYSVGIGEASGSVLSYIDETGKRMYFTDQKGEKLRADIDEPTLTEIANLSNGKYFHARDSQLFEKIFDELDKTVRSKIVYKNETVEVSIASLLYIVLMIFIFLHFLQARYVRKKYKIQ